MIDANQGAATSRTAYDIYGTNLLGFRDADHEPFTGENLPWDLEGQIQGIYRDVAARRVPLPDGEVGDDGRRERPYDFVILMGHSVGAYISVEIFHRHIKDSSRAPHLNLRHGFLLFPTLTDIARSSSGRRLSLLQCIPRMEANAHFLAQFVLCYMSIDWLLWIITNIMGFSPQTANLTARWLKSRDGVHQAIHLGLSEMRTIREDQWEEELWEVAAEDGKEDLDIGVHGFNGGKTVLQQQTPKFFMFYGKRDHWVASHIRDMFIQRRAEHGERGGRTKISIDEGDIPHAFCVREHTSWLIAKKVYEWIEEVEAGL